MTAVALPRKGVSTACGIFSCLLLGATISARLAVADDRPDGGEAQGQDAAAVSSTNNSSNSSPGRVESSMFSSFFMAGKTQKQFKPLTPKERLLVYTKSFRTPFHLLMVGVPAGTSQLEDVPKEWGLGAAGFGRRYANYYGYAAVRSMLQMSGEDLLHEDNLYYGSGEQRFGKRVKYAVKSSVLARGNDGSQHFSVSQVGSTAAAAFISRLWQPRSTGSAGDGAISFGISMATNASVNVVREFLPDITRHIFHASEGRQ